MVLSNAQRLDKTSVFFSLVRKTLDLHVNFEAPKDAQKHIAIYLVETQCPSTVGGMSTEMRAPL